MINVSNAKNIREERLEQPDIAIVIPTIERFFPCVRDLVLSIERHANIGHVIHVGVQGRVDDRMTRFSTEHDIRIHSLPYDLGLSATRNFLVKQTQEPLILLCDDDVQFTENTDVAAARKFMRANSDVKIVGGAYYTSQIDGSWRLENHACRFCHDVKRNMLVSIPLSYCEIEPCSFDGYNYYECDMVNNFALIDRTLFTNDGIWWDERFKIRGEHEDFFLTIKKAGPGKIVYSNCLVGNHIRVKTPRFYQLRKRYSGLISFMDKWNLVTHVVVGKKLVYFDRDTHKVRKVPFEVRKDLF